MKTQVIEGQIEQYNLLAKRRPGQLHYSSPGNGGPQHLVTELIKLETGIDELRKIVTEAGLEFIDGGDGHPGGLVVLLPATGEDAAAPMCSRPTKARNAVPATCRGGSFDQRWFSTSACVSSSIMARTPARGDARSRA